MKRLDGFFNDNNSIFLLKKDNLFNFLIFQFEI